MDLVRTTWRSFLSTLAPVLQRREHQFDRPRDLSASGSLDPGDRLLLPGPAAGARHGVGAAVADGHPADHGTDVVSHRIEDLEWTVQTGLSPTDVRAAGRSAAAGGPDDGALREDICTAGSVSYAVSDTDSLATRMSLVVSWHELGGGRRQVTLTVRGHNTRRRRLLGLVPVGPAVVPAWSVAERFSGALRERLLAG